MATWGVALAKAKFSEVLDKTEQEGPQLVRRRQQEFFVLTREQRDALMSGAKFEVKAEGVPGKRTMSEFFRNSPLVGSGIDLKRINLKPRHIDF